MCFQSAPPQDNSAAIARQQAQQRQDAITAGKGNIDQAFSSFTPDYYANYGKQFEDYYNPQVDHQFAQARQAVTYNTARAGTENATAGQKAFGDLTDAYTQQRQSVASQAQGASNDLRAKVEQNKSDLYSENTAAADPSLAAASAAGHAGSLETAPSFSPLGSLFAGLINTGASYLNGANKGLPTGYSTAFSPGGTLPSSGSGRVVN